MTRIALLLVACLPLWALADLGDYFNDGLTWGGGLNAGAKGIINEQEAKNTLPMYGDTADPAALFGDAKTSVVEPATDKVTGCAVNPADPDQYKRQECEAINFWQNNPAVHPQFNISRTVDPVVTRAQNIRGNPIATTGVMPGITGTYSDCVEKVIPGDPIYSTEICSETGVIEAKSCDRVREVVVDQDFDYECKDNPNQKVIYPCSKTLTVEVTINKSCVNGTWFPVGYLRRADGGTQVQVEAFCETSRTDGKMQFRFTPIGLHGVCQLASMDLPTSEFTVAGQNQLSAYWGNDGWTVINALGLPISNWKGGCTVAFPVGFAAGYQGCSGDICIYTFMSLESGAGAYIASPATPMPAGYSTYTVVSGGPRWGDSNHYGPPYQFNKNGVCIPGQYEYPHAFSLSDLTYLGLPSSSWTVDSLCAGGALRARGSAQSTDTQSFNIPLGQTDVVPVLGATVRPYANSTYGYRFYFSGQSCNNATKLCTANIAVVPDYAPDWYTCPAGQFNGVQVQNCDSYGNNCSPVGPISNCYQQVCDYWGCSWQYTVPGTKNGLNVIHSWSQSFHSDSTVMTYTTTDTWDNQCLPLELKAQ